MTVTCAVTLPSASGCNHIHFTLTFPDNHTEFYSYHLTDFTSTGPTQSEEIYHKLRTLILSSEAKTRTAIRTLLNNKSITI